MGANCRYSQKRFRNGPSNSRQREWFEDRLPEDHDLEADELATLRAREVDRLLGNHCTHDEVERRAGRGQRHLLERLDDDLVLERAREIEGDRAPRVVERAAAEADAASAVESGGGRSFEPSD